MLESNRALSTPAKINAKKWPKRSTTQTKTWFDFAAVWLHIAAAAGNLDIREQISVTFYWIRTFCRRRTLHVIPRVKASSSSTYQFWSPIRRESSLRCHHKLHRQRPSSSIITTIPRLVMSVQIQAGMNSLLSAQDTQNDKITFRCRERRKINDAWHFACNQQFQVPLIFHSWI